MTELYDQRIDAMKARERVGGLHDQWLSQHYKQRQRNIDRLAAYKRKRDVKSPGDIALAARQEAEYRAWYKDFNGFDMP